jgi:phosphatidylglycerophosphatase A
MSIEFKTVIKNPSLLISTGFGVGLVPFAPGTFGSGVGLCLYIILAHFTQVTTINGILAYFLLLAVSFVVVDQSIKELGNKDHQEIVIDEILAMMLVAHFIPPDPKWAIGAFLIFRFFDIVKPFPIRQIEASQNNAFGIIVDDQIAAGYSIIVILILKYLMI